MNYPAHYSRLIERAQSRILDGYSEKHHAVPKCIGGTNTADNIVRLTAEEHYVAHQLLVKIYPGNHRLLWAAVAMTNKTKVMKRSGNKLYGWLRRKFADSMSKKWSGHRHSDEARRKMSETRKGLKRGPHTEATKLKMSIASKGKKKSAESIARGAATKTGRKLPPRSDEWRANQSSAIRKAIASGCKRADQKTPEYRELMARKMREVWEKRRAGIIPDPKWSGRKARVAILQLL